MGKLIPKIDEEKCIKCGACVAACPHGALEMVDFPVLTASKCTSAQECKKVCPVDAITMVEE